MHSVSLKSSPVETVHTFCNLLSEHESNGHLVEESVMYLKISKNWYFFALFLQVLQILQERISLKGSVYIQLCQ